MHGPKTASLLRKNGEGGIRTPVGLKAQTGFRDRRIQPLCHLSSGKTLTKVDDRRGSRGLAAPRPAGSASAGEERPEHVPRLLAQQAALALRPVVELGDVEQVKHASGGAGLGVARGEDDAGDS